MFPVFKISLIVLFIQFGNTKVHARMTESISPLEMFHPQGGIFDIIDHQSLESHDPSINIEVFVINQEEPYNNPMTLQVYLQFDHNAFMKLNRRIHNKDENTYCQVGEAQLLKGHEINLNDGIYLVLPVSRFNEESALCPEFFEKNEIYSLH